MTVRIPKMKKVSLATLPIDDLSIDYVIDNLSKIKSKYPNAICKLISLQNSYADEPLPVTGLFLYIYKYEEDILNGS